MSKSKGVLLTRRRMLGAGLASGAIFGAGAGGELKADRACADMSVLTGHAISSARQARIVSSLRQTLGQFEPVRALSIDEKVEPAFRFQAGDVHDHD